MNIIKSTLVFLALTTMVFKSVDAAVSKDVSIISLISNPEKHLDQEITVIGFYSYGAPPFVYPNRDLAEAMDESSGIQILINKQIEKAVYSCDTMLVKISGKLQEKNGLLRIGNINEMLLAKNLEPCK